MMRVAMYLVLYSVLFLALSFASSTPQAQVPYLKDACLGNLQTRFSCFAEGWTVGRRGPTYHVNHKSFDLSDLLEDANEETEALGSREIAYRVKDGMFQMYNYPAWVFVCTSDGKLKRVEYREKFWFSEMHKFKVQCDPISPTL